MKTYKFEWKTAEEIIANKGTKLVFSTWSKTPTSLQEVLEEYRETENIDEAIRKAHELWLKLEDRFNREAKGYDPELYQSRLGSVGDVERREVLRSAWWDVLDGDDYGDYDVLTLIIEFLHHGEKLATGTILFGS